MIEKERMTEYFLELVKIDSLSKKEKEVAIKMKKDMEELGADVFIDNVGEKVNGDTGNLLVKIKGNKSDAPPFFLSSHMDTVGPGEGIKPRREGNLIKSDGTTILGSDDKSGLSIIVEVVRTLKEKGIPHGDIEIAFTICEEIGLLGAKYLDTSRLRSKYGLVLDSSHPGHLIVKCPSAERLEFKVYGLEAHAGVCPERGISAIKIAGEAIAKMKLGRIDTETTANIGVVQGGLAINIVPNYVLIEGEARSHDEKKLRRQVEHMRKRFCDAVSRYSITIDGETYRARIEEHIERSYDRMDISTESKAVKLVNQAVDNLGYSVEAVATGGGCDANYFNQKGIECANLGTGMKDVHTVKEHLILDEFYRTADILLETLKLNSTTN